ncbi:MAG: hypothetical protein QXZ02_06225 [Candidatus Bathyarchaeia archaeon]
MKNYFENFISKIRSKSILQLPSYFKKLSKNISSKNLYLSSIQAGGILSILLGILFSALGFFGLATGKGITFAVASGTISIDPILASITSSIAGIILTFEGIALLKVNFEISRLIIFSIVSGYCTLNVPAILLGLNYGLFAGIFAIVFGYLWLVAILAWLQRGE